jgi:hypothetical protein
MGLVPYQTISGDKGLIEVIRDRYEIDPTETQEIGMGAALTLDVNGYVRLLLPYSETAPNSSANKIIGVFQGCTYQLPAVNGDITPLQRSEYFPGNVRVATGTKIFAHVIVDPNVIYTIQTNEGTTGLTQSALGANGNIFNQTSNDASSRGDSVTPGMINAASVGQGKQAVADDYHLKIIGVDPTGSNDFGSDTNKKPFNNVLVTINNHLFAHRSSANS